MHTIFASLLRDLHGCQKFVHHCIRYEIHLLFPNLSLHTVGSYVVFTHCILQYIRKLLFSDLDKSAIENVLRQLRKLPWSECEQYLLKCFMKVHKGKYGQIHLIASLTSGLSRYHDEFSVAVVDEVSSLKMFST